MRYSPGWNRPYTISVTNRGEFEEMVDYLCDKLQLKRTAVLKYCVARVYHKEKMDESRMIDYLDGDMVK